MDAAMTAPTAAAAMATVMVETENRSSMRVSFCPAVVLLERILLNAHEISGVVFCRRVRASSLRKGELFQARRQHHRRVRVVPFDAAGLGINSVFLVALPGELLLDGPRPGPHGRILDGRDVFERGRAAPGPALDQMQVLARPLNIG